MDTTKTWLLRVLIIVLIGPCLITDLNVQKKTTLLFSKPSIEDFKYKELYKKQRNAEFPSKRNNKDYKKFGNRTLAMLHFIVGFNQHIIQ